MKEGSSGSQLFQYTRLVSLLDLRNANPASTREKGTIGLGIDSARLSGAAGGRGGQAGVSDFPRQAGLKRLSISEDADDAGILEFLLLDVSARLADRERRYGDCSLSLSLSLPLRSSSRQKKKD